MLWKTILRSSSLRERYSFTRKEICEKSSPQRKRSAGKMILMRKRKGQAAEEDRLPALLSVRQTCYFSLGYLIHAGMTRNVITTFSSPPRYPRISIILPAALLQDQSSTILVAIFSRNARSCSIKSIAG